MKNYKREKKKQNKGFWGWFWAITKWFVVVGGITVLIGLMGGIAVFSKYAEETPTLDLNRLGNPKPSLFYDINGELIAEVGEEPRIETTIDAVPVEFMNALIAVEDSRFFYHRGIDPIRIGRAGITSLQGNFGAEGGSTLTQQLVKLSFLDPKEQSISRKSQEAVLAWNLEQVYSKEEILTSYINKVYMGSGVYGIETAAQYYYGVGLSELEPHQMALLAGIPAAPSSYNPYANVDYAQERRDTVLGRMNRIGVLSDEEYTEYVSRDVLEGVVEKGQGKEIYKAIQPEYQEYVDQVMKQLVNEVDIDVRTQPVVVHTALDPEKQKALNDEVYRDASFNWTGNEIQAIVAAVGVKDGRVRAIAGGNGTTKEFGVVSGYSFPVDGRHQPASTIKPILDYAPALEYLDVTMNSTIVDKPTTYSTGQQVNNFDGQYKGAQTLALALKGSRNTSALQLLKQVGVDRAYTLANEMGLGVPEDEWFESGAIGAMNVSMLNLANSFATIGNNGAYNKPTYITKVESKDGIVLWEPEAQKQVLEPQNAKALVQALRPVVQDQSAGFGRTAYVEGYDIAGKTGTNNFGENERGTVGGRVPSVAFVGFTPDVAISVYVEGEKRTRGLQYPYEQGLARQAFKNILPKLSDDKSKFE